MWGKTSNPCQTSTNSTHNRNTQFPSGWYVCNGSNGTPNLSDKFIKGTSTLSGVGGTGGSHTKTLTTANLPSHAHTLNSHTHAINHDHASFTSGGSSASNTGSALSTHYHSYAHAHTASSASAGSHSHTITVNSGGSHTHAITITGATVTIKSNECTNHTHSITISANDNFPKTLTRIHTGITRYDGNKTATAGNHSTRTWNPSTIAETSMTQTPIMYISVQDLMWQGNRGENEDINANVNWGGETVLKSHANFYGVTSKRAQTSNGAGSWASTITHRSLPFSVQACIKAGTLNHNHTGTCNSGGLHEHTFTHNHTASSASAGSHNHTASSASAGSHSHKITVNSGGGNTSTANLAHTHTMAHTHSIDVPAFTGTSGKASGNTGSVGSGTAFNIEPAYYRVVFIMRIS